MRSHTSRVLWSLACSLVLLLTCSPIPSHAAPRAASGPAFTWSNVSVDPGAPAEPAYQARVAGVSCPSDQFCAAVSDNGSVTIKSNGTWQNWQKLGSFTGDSDVACTSDQFCMALLGANQLWQWNGRTWQHLRTLQPTSVNHTGIACANEHECYLTGAAPGHCSTLFDPASPEQMLCPVPETIVMNHVDCHHGSCIGWDSTKNMVSVRTSENSQFGRWETPIRTTSSPVLDAECWADGECFALTSDGIVTRISNGTAHAAMPVFSVIPGRGPAQGGHLSCSDGSCLATLDQPNLPGGSPLPSSLAWWQGTRWTQMTGGFSQVTDLNCDGKNSCVLATGNKVLETTPQASTLGTQIPDTEAAPTGTPVQTLCPQQSQCFTVRRDAAGTPSLWSWNGTTSSEVLGMPTVNLSCPAKNFCMAQLTGNRYSTWNGRTWSAPADMPAANGPSDQPWSHLACSSPNQCWAAGTIARPGLQQPIQALRWDGRQWADRPVALQTDSTYTLTAWDCSSSGLCAAVLSDGSVRPSYLRFSNGVSGTVTQMPAGFSDGVTVQDATVSCTNQYCVVGSPAAATLRLSMQQSTALRGGVHRLSSLTCPTDDTCVGTLDTAEATMVTITGGRAYTQELHAPAWRAPHTACYSASGCIVLDSNGRSSHGSR